MRLLVLGGTEFVGQAVVDDALRRGWEVTVFHRGRHPAPVGVRDVLGDRTAPGELARLARGEWDLVVDTLSWAPAAVRDAAGYLAGRAARYAYVSSRSVYRYPGPRGATEAAPVVDADPDAPGEAAYPQAKRGAELAVLAAFGDRALLARAGLVLGPRENVGRLPWWLLRTARGGRVLAPGPCDSPLQYVDARDLAAFLLDAGVGGRHGPYDVVSPAGHTTMGELLAACVAATGAHATLCWTEPAAILAAGVEPWTELPIWLPPGPDHDTMHGADVSRALAAGLRCRPVAETVVDTWTWLRSLDGPLPQRPDRPPVGLSPQREAAVLGS